MEIKKQNYFLLIIVSFFISTHLFAAGSSFSSKDEKSGVWTSALIWQAGIAPSTSLGNNNNITINGTVEVISDLSFNNNSTLLINTNDTLIVNGNLSVNTNSLITINSGGVLIIMGSFSSNNNIDIATSGKVVVFGNFTVASNAVINISTANSLFVFGTAVLPSVVFPNSSDIGTKMEFLSGEPALQTWLDTEYNTNLPIELVSFEAFVTPQDIQFSWVTKSENNNDFYTLSYSIDGKEFINLATIQGNGTTSNESIYEYIYDNYTIEGIVYFRLQQTDYNGNYTFSPIISIHLPDKDVDVFIFPNPAVDYITIQDNSQSITNIQFFDQIHNEIVLPKVDLYTYSLISIPTGIYFVKITTDSKCFVKTIVKK